MSINKSCLDCPALLDRFEARGFFGVAKAPPMCSRFGHVLGELTDVESLVFEDAASKLATGCTSFGEQKALTPPTFISGSWFNPRPDLLEVKTGGPSSCLDCVNYDEPGQACAATGRIIFPERHTQEAAGCTWSDYTKTGIPNNTADVRLSAYGSTTQVFLNTTASNQKPPQAAPTPRKHRTTKVVDPTTYSSDATVTDEHKANGIRAWMQHDTERGKTYFLPIFDSAFFGDRASLIPSSKSEHGDPTLYIDHAGLKTEFAVQVYKKDLNLVMVGEPGTGKTEGWRYMAYTCNMPFVRLAYNENSEPEHFLGLMQFNQTQGTFVLPGDLPENWILPGFLLSDEPNLAPEAIMQVYRMMNDSSRQLAVYKERFLRHDYCFHAMAINPHWDFRNIGAKPLASADSRRLAFMWMPNPDNEQLRAIITQTVKKLDDVTIDKKLLTIIIKIGEDLRQMSKLGTLPDFWTVSQEIKVARLVEDFGLEGAYRRAYFNYIDPQDAAPAMKAIKSHVPYGSDWE